MVDQLHEFFAFVFFERVAYGLGGAFELFSEFYVGVLASAGLFDDLNVSQGHLGLNSDHSAFYQV